MNSKKYAFIDLHLHLDGSLSPEIIIEVAKEENITLPTYDPKELKKHLEIDETCKSLGECLQVFDLPNLVLQTKNGLRKCTLDLLKREANAGLKYVEIRMAPQLSTAKELTQDEVVETLISTLKEGEKLYSIKSNLILCLMRLDNNEKANIETVNVAKKYLGKGVVALDLAGAEDLFPNENFAKCFELAKKLNIPSTIHSGEARGAEAVKSALDLGASRIGHGINARFDEKVLNEIIEKQISLEICPQSNYYTKAVQSIYDLPIKEFLEKGVLFSINSDDMTVLQTTLENEYKILEKLGLNEQNIKQIAINSIKSAFLSDEEKADLMKYIN